MTNTHYSIALLQKCLVIYLLICDQYITICLIGGLKKVLISKASDFFFSELKRTVIISTNFHIACKFI